jgi:hypothetical protein
VFDDLLQVLLILVQRDMLFVAGETGVVGAEEEGLANGLTNSQFCFRNAIRTMNRTLAVCGDGKHLWKILTAWAVV